MGFYLQVEFESSLTAAELKDQLLTPLREVLQREGLGRILGLDPKDSSVVPGNFILALEVTDQSRARAVVERFVIEHTWE